MVIAKWLNMDYIAVFILAPCGYDICSQKFSASLYVLNLDATNCPAMFPDKVFIYAALIDINTLMFRYVF